MCYGYGLRENELNSASPQFVSLFLQGHSQRNFEQFKTDWERARFIASAMSSGAGKVRFAWEKPKFKDVQIDPKIWEKFTIEEGKPATIQEVQKVFGLN